ncbi:MAG: DUF6691 family protein [Salibacteraceae bacterium]
MKRVFAFLIGVFFSTVLIKGEVISWFRIQEMFRFESFHMFGIIGSAVCVGAISVFLIKKFNLSDINGNPIVIKPKPKQYKANLLGGTIFGLGWAFSGACPGPLYAHVGYGHTTMVITILFAVLGVYVYGIIRDKLPH